MPSSGPAGRKTRSWKAGGSRSEGGVLLTRLLAAVTLLGLAALMFSSRGEPSSPRPPPAAAPSSASDGHAEQQLRRENAELRAMLDLLAGSLSPSDAQSVVATMRGRRFKASPRASTPASHDAAPAATRELSRGTLCSKACYAQTNEVAKSETFREILLTGRKRFANKRVVIAGLVHNSESGLKKVHAHMKRSVEGALDHRVIMFENDSKDKTAAVMKTICAADPKTICLNEKGYGNPTQYGPFARRRFDLMAGFRNKLLDVIVGDPELQSWDTVIMVDMDLFGKAWLPGGYPEWESNSQGWKADMIPTLFGYPDSDSHDVMCGNGVFNHGKYYDTLAYRDPRVTDTLHDENLLHAEMDRLRFSGAALAPVHSCFGGIAAYRIASLLQSGCRYVGGDCEHIGLNTCLRQHGFGKVAINPLLTAHYDSSIEEVCTVPCA